MLLGMGWWYSIFLGGGVLLGLSNPHPIPDHVQLILRPIHNARNEMRRNNMIQYASLTSRVIFSRWLRNKNSINRVKSFVFLLSFPFQRTE